MTIASLVPEIDVFVDLGSLPAGSQLGALDSLVDQGDLLSLGGRFTIVVDCPARPFSSTGAMFPSRQGVVALRRAKRAAALAGRGLLMLLRGAAIAPEAARRLPQALAEDPMLGCVEPRFVCGGGPGIVALPPEHREGRLLSRRLVAALPPTYLGYDRLAACLYIAPAIARLLPDDVIDGCSGAEQAVAVLIAEARRRGFRTIIDNRHVAEILHAGDAYPDLSTSAADNLRARYPEYDEVARRSAALPHGRREAALAAGLDARHGQAPRLLLECKGLGALHNGTSEALLGMLDGLSRIETPWKVELLVTPGAQAFHELHRRYPRFRQLMLPPEKPAAVALRLSQPYHLGTIHELHRCGLRIGTMILDTIAWDIAWAETEELGPSLQLAAGYCDAVLFNSGFTRDRFNYRFPQGPGVLQCVTHHSFHAADYIRGRPNRHDKGPILLFGNAYPHKAIAETLDLLRRCFPFQAVTVLGGPPIDGTGSTITQLPSGHLRAEEIDRLYAEARLLLYPSYYEGFGLPVVRGLNQGLDVVVRRSSLASEIAACCRAPGRLLAFETPAEMVEVIGRALAGEPVEALAQGGAIRPGEEPLDWTGVARRVIDLADALLAEDGMAVYDRRDTVLSLIRRDGFL